MNRKEWNEFKARNEAKKTPMVYQTEVLLERTSKKTGKPYKQWLFVGWGQLPNVEEFEHTQKGEWLIVTLPNGRKERYNTESGVQRG